MCVTHGQDCCCAAVAAAAAQAAAAHVALSKPVAAALHRIR